MNRFVCVAFSTPIRPSFLPPVAFLLETFLLGTFLLGTLAFAYDGDIGPRAGADREQGRMPSSIVYDPNRDLEASAPLGDADFSLRRRSTIELWRDRDRYRAAVLAAARSEELETAERAQWVLGRWQRGILSNTPIEMVKKLESLSPVEAIEFLLETERFAAATIAMQEAVGTLDYDAVTARVSMTLDQRFPVYARAAVMTGQAGVFFDFLDVACVSKELAVCRRDWAKLFCEPQRVEGVVAVDTLDLPSAAAQWTPMLLQQTQCLLHLLDGDFDAAMKSALQSDQELRKSSAGQNGLPPTSVSQAGQPLERLVGMVSSQWFELATASAASARALEEAAGQSETSQPTDANPPTPLNSRQLTQYQEEAIRHWSDALIAADRCGDSQLRQAAVDGLQRYRENEKISAEVRALLWRSLLIHGQLDAGLEIVGRSDPAAASVIALDASRGHEALDRLGFSVDLIETQLETWIDEGIAAQRKLHEAAASEDPQEAAEAVRQSENGLAPEVEKLFSLMRLLDTLSRDDLAWRIADRLSLEDLMVKRIGQSTEYLVRDYVLLALIWTNHTDWMIRLAMRDWEEKPSAISQSLISKITVTEDYQVLEVLSRYLKIREPGMSSQDVFRTACEIARGEDQDRRNHAQRMTGLAEALQDESLRAKMELETEFATLFDSHRSVWSDLFQAHGRPDLAETFLRDRAAGGDLQAAFTLAKEYRLSDASRAAMSTYETIWRAVASSPVNSDAYHSEELMTGVRAVAEQFRLARDSGDVNSADAISLQLRAMACTPSTDMRQEIADVLGECGQWESADAVYQSLLMITAMTADETQSLIDVARKYQRFAVKATAKGVEQTESSLHSNAIEALSTTDLELRRRAIEWFDIAFVATLNEVDFRPEIYLIYPRLIAREQAELDIVELASVPHPNPARPAISRARENVVKRLDRLQQLDQMDITTAESILPKLQTVGIVDPVATFMENMLATAKRHLKTFPTDAVTANNVAWGAAVNDTQLESALQLSRHAVRFEPDSAIYRDTLAEILARLGNPAEALVIERGCVLDDPGQWHLHEQIERFQKKTSKPR